MNDSALLWNPYISISDRDIRMFRIPPTVFRAGKFDIWAESFPAFFLLIPISGDNGTQLL